MKKVILFILIVVCLRVNAQFNQSAPSLYLSGAINYGEIMSEFGPIKKLFAVNKMTYKVYDEFLNIKFLKANGFSKDQKSTPYKALQAIKVAYSDEWIAKLIEGRPYFYYSKEQQDFMKSEKWENNYSLNVIAELNDTYKEKEYCSMLVLSKDIIILPEIQTTV